MNNYPKIFFLFILSSVYINFKLESILVCILPGISLSMDHCFALMLHLDLQVLN